MKVVTERLEAQSYASITRFIEDWLKVAPYDVIYSININKVPATECRDKTRQWRALIIWT